MDVTEEELNFLRFYFLNLKIATNAVRVYFDYVHPPAGLAGELIKSSLTLKGLRFMTKLQLNILYPSPGQSVTSAEFDTTLIVFLLRNLPPRESASLTGWDNLPPPGDTSIGADLARVKWYRNQSVHNKDGILSSTDFNKRWGDLEGAIGRLSAKGGVSMIKETQLAKHVVLEGSLKDMLLELRSCNKSQQELTEKINNHQSALDVLRTNKEEHEQKIHQVHVSHQKGEAETQKLSTELSDYKTEYAEKLKACKNDIKKNEGIIKELQDQSDKKQNKIGDLILHRCKLEIKYEQHDKMLKEHDDHLALLDGQASKQGEQIAEQTEQLAQQSEQMAQHSEQMAQQSEQMAQQGEQMAQQVEQMVQQWEQIAQQGGNNQTRLEGRSNQTRLEDDVVPTEIKLMSDKSSVPIYLKLLESGSEKKRDIRLVIVGKKGAGKTSLLKRLFGEELGAVDSTNGIEIHRIKCKTRSTDVNWRKISGNNEEFERNSRLLIPYRERLKCQKEVAESHTTQSNQHEEKVTTHHIGTVETSEQGVDRNSINDNTILSSEEILYSRTASDQPEKVSLRISHKAEKLISHVTADETEKQQSNLSVDQANEEIKEMLNSEVDFNDKNEYATLLLWDFAGDKEFYHTHQTFLSPDSIYVVVTNLNEADNKEAQGIFRLWMDSIHCYCRPNEFSYISNNDTKSISEDPFDPPVILVGTWKDQVQNPAGEEIMDVCHESLYKFAEDVSEDACRHIRDEYTHFVSNTDDDDTAFQPLREHILQLARTMKTWNTNYPLKFIQLEKRLQEKKKELPIVSLHDLKLITSETQNPLNNEELMLFLKFHHEIRALIFFEDLSDYIILDAQWLSDAFKVVVTAKKFQKKSMKNRRKWDEFYSSGKLHSFVLKDMFKNQPNMLSEYKDYILNVMEKFDIIIRPNILDKDTGHEESCYYVPCIITHEPDCDIYTMLNATADTCQRSTWLCFKFTFLPPHLMNHLIASLCRRYKIAELVDSRQTKKRIALFKGTVVFDVDKLTELQKLLVITRSDLIQMQILEFGTNVVFGKGVYKLITKFVTKEINKIINTRFKMTNLKFSKKWECGLAQPDSVTGSRDFGEQHIIEYNCGMCRQIHKAADEWSDLPTESLGCIHHAQGSDPQTETLTENKTVISTKVYVKGITSVSTNVSGVAGSGDTNNKLSNEEKNFTRMGMTALNILADVLYDLLKLDGQNVYSRGEYDITKLYNEHRNLNKHKPSNSSNRFRGPWGGAWQNIHNTDTAVGDDIERIRLTRNELQHSPTYALGDTRFNELCDITHDMLRRFDQHNRPKKLYSCRFKEVQATIISDEEAKNVRQQFECKMDTETVFQIEVSNELYKPPTKKTKHQN